MFREVYYKIKNIFPNVIASSELIILCSQLKESLSENICQNDISSTMLLSTPFVSQDASATLHDHRLPSTFGFTHNNGICHSSIQIPLPFFQNNCKYIEQHMVCFPSSNQLRIHKTPPLTPWQVCGVFNCTNPVTLAQVSLFAENTGRFVRRDFLHNTVVVFPCISYSCISLLFLREQFLPNYSIFRSQI